MESISIQVPASLYTSIYEHFGEETTSAVIGWLAKLSNLVNEEVVAEPQIEGAATLYPRPRTGTITGRVWEIADQIQKQSGRAEREVVIKVCMGEGIKINTASTQFSHWRKANP